MSNARNIADLAGDTSNLEAISSAYGAGALSNRNLIINGAMQVAQRGTSHSTVGYGSLDRWLLSLSGGTATMSQETFTLGQTDVPSQFRNYMRVDATSGNNYLGLFTKIENVYAVEGQVVLSFYAKGTNPGGGSFAIDIGQLFGSGGSSAVYTSLTPFTVTSSWQRFEIPFTLPSLSGKTVGTGSYIEVYPHQAVGDTSTDAWTLDITGVQLEVGDTATPFEHRSYGQELALCQRYYWRTSTVGSSWAQMGAGVIYATTDAYAVVRLPCDMRASPTCSYSGTTGDVQTIAGGVSLTSTTATVISEPTPQAFRIDTVFTGGTVGHGCWVRMQNMASNYFDADAEL